MIGGFGSVIIIGTMAALERYYLNTGYKPGNNGAVAMYFLFGTWFTSTIECTAYVYASEIWPTHLRSKGATIAYASFFANAIAYAAPVTVALNTIGWKYYMVGSPVICVKAIAHLDNRFSLLLLPLVPLRSGSTSPRYVPWYPSWQKFVKHG